jgi:hypothetical protein
LGAIHSLAEGYHIQGTGREKLFFHKQYCRLDFKIQLKIVSHPEALSKANYQSNQNV